MGVRIFAAQDDDQNQMPVYQFASADGISSGLPYDGPSQTGQPEPPPTQLDIAVGPMAVGVPEPASWLTMILGVGCVGLALRRRRASAIRASGGCSAEPIRS
jgi:hypothetical protein